MTGDEVESAHGVILLAHNRKITYKYSGRTAIQTLYCSIESGSIVVDPWRTYISDDKDVTVIHYGNTRS